jgi:hypothetical protein
VVEVLVTDAAHTIEYASARSEVWRWYWRAWAAPKGLWMYHVVIALSVSAVLQLGGWGLNARRFFTAAVIIFILCVLLLPLYPQLRFKSTVRSLTIDPSGIKSTRGKQSLDCRWKDIAAIEDAGDAIVITRAGANRNSFIIPRRAFTDDAGRTQFLRDARLWQQQSR